MQDSRRDTDVKKRCVDSVRRWGWDDMKEQHWNMYIIICETDHQSRFYAWDRVLRAGALGWPWGMGRGGRWEAGSGWGTHVHPWLIHVKVWQKPPQYCKAISLQLKLISKNKNKIKNSPSLPYTWIHIHTSPVPIFWFPIYTNRLPITP